MVIESVHLPGKSGLWDLRIEAGRIRQVLKIREKREREYWCIPALSDLHIHLGWTDFFREDQAKRTPDEIRERIGESVKVLRRMGYTRVRDAGGLTPVEEKTMKKVCETKLHTEEDWVKIFATGGVGAGQRVLDPLCTETAFEARIRELKGAGKKVMVHTYGGRTLDWCIRYGADSVEHGVYMTREQAERLGQAGIGYVPTVCIYRMLADEPGWFKGTEIFRENAKAAAWAHPKAVGYALDAGVRIGVGTDFFADPALLRCEPLELAALSDCGIRGESLLEAACRDAGGRVRKIEAGEPSELLIFSEDPETLLKPELWEESLLQVLTV